MRSVRLGYYLGRWGPRAQRPFPTATRAAEEAADHLKARAEEQVDNEHNRQHADYADATATIVTTSMTVVTASTKQHEDNENEKY